VFLLYGEKHQSAKPNATLTNRQLKLFFSISLFFLCCVASLVSFSQGSWAPKANLPGSPRAAATAFSIGTKGYIAVGDCSPYTKELWEWDQTSGSWTPRAPFGGTARDEAAGFSIGNFGYIGTGIDGAGKKDFWEWDQALDTWTQRMDFPGTPRGDAVGFSIGTKGYILTGQNIFSTLVQDLWVWDQTTGIWSSLPDFTAVGRAGAVAFSLGNKGYFGTGIDQSNNFLKDFWEFDQTTGSWTQMADFGGTGRYFAAGFGIDGCKPKGYIGTGMENLSGGITNDLWEWNQAGNIWTVMANFGGSQRWKAVGFAIGGKGYIGTGQDAGGFTNDLWEFTPDSVSLKPVSLFSSSNNCAGGIVAFHDLSSVPAPNTIQSWNWDFGDGTAIDTAENPHHIYLGAGTYTTTLIVSNNFGCKDTLLKSVSIFPTPVANYTQNAVCLGAPMNFSNTSSVATPELISAYSWNFGDMSPASNTQNPSHIYSLADTFNVSLITITSHSCSDTIANAVYVYGAPAVNFTAGNNCLNDSTHFVNTTVNPVMNSIASWIWDFGDGSQANALTWSSAHLYDFPGNYQVELIVNSSHGCADTLISPVVIYPLPLSNFSFMDVCLNQTTNFTDLSSVPGGTINFWNWNFNDASTVSTSQNPNYIYTNAGTYAVSLDVIDNNGCKDTVVKNVTIHPLPQSLFATANVCDGSFAQFNNLSTISGTDLIQASSWNFGDGNSVGNQNASHLYVGAGTYSVSLVSVSNFGCVDSISKVVIVNPNPVVNFTGNPASGCEPLCVSFSDSSFIASGSNGQWSWNIGDGSPLNNSSVFEHCYTNDSINNSNLFNVTLTVTSDSGCTSSLTKNNYITVYPNPNAAFTAQPSVTTITDPVIEIVNTTTGADTWNWNFGDTQTDSVSAPKQHAYADTGTYTITLITTTQYNCSDTAYQTAIVEPDFTFYIPNAFTPDGDGINDTFTGKGIFIKNFEMMIFDRWGNLIYKTEAIDKPWDGRANGGKEMAQRDVYVYAVIVTDFKNVKHKYRGTVTLVR
jgi:gliding motility-associated-like protein